MFDPTTHTWFKGLVIELFASIDKIAYSLVSFIYQIFFNVASANILSGDTVKTLFSRIQLILGVAIVFKLAVTLISGIIEPDKINDGKNGAGKLVTRILTALILMITIVPLNIPEEGIKASSYEAQLNNNGILFGTLYEFQNRILTENTLAKLILGTDGNRLNLSKNPEDAEKNMKESGRFLATTILKSFITVNMAEGKEDEDPKTESNRLCSDEISQNDVENYLSENNNPTLILNMVHHDCEEGYVFNYLYIISTLAIGLIIAIMIGFTLDIAIRALKLAILRLIAPVPIIGYVNAKSDNGALNTWGKAVLKTYVDVFIRLVVIFLILFLIEEFTTHGITLPVSSGMVGSLSYVMIVIALFYFAREAPKFMLESMGIKYTGGYFSGMGKMLGIGSALLRMPGAVASNFRASKLSTETRNAATAAAKDANPDESFHLLRNKGRDFAIALRNRTNNLRAGMSAVGGIFGGAATGISAAVTAQDHQARAVAQAMSQRNSQTIAAGNAGSTGLGRLESVLSRALFGETQAEIGKRMISSLESQKSALEAIKARVSGEMVKADYTSGRLGLTDAHGHQIEANYKSFIAALEASKSNTSSTFSFVDSHGITQTIRKEDGERQKGFLLKNNESDYLYQQLHGMAPAGKEDQELMHAVNESKALNPTWYNDIMAVTDNHKVRDHVNPRIESLNSQITTRKRQNATAEQNDRFSQQNSRK